MVEFAAGLQYCFQLSIICDAALVHSRMTHTHTMEHLERAEGKSRRDLLIRLLTGSNHLRALLPRESDGVCA
jgi:hypothetical protein